jgi:hypothetical protein
MGHGMTCATRENATGADWRNWRKKSGLRQCASWGYMLHIYTPQTGATGALQPDWRRLAQAGGFWA